MAELSYGHSVQYTKMQQAVTGGEYLWDLVLIHEPTKLKIRHIMERPVFHEKEYYPVYYLNDETKNHIIKLLQQVLGEAAKKVIF